MACLLLNIVSSKRKILHPNKDVVNIMNFFNSLTYQIQKLERRITMKTKLMTMRIPEGLHQELKLTAVKQNTTMTDIITESIKRAIESYKKKTKK